MCITGSVQCTFRCPHTLLWVEVEEGDYFASFLCWVLWHVAREIKHDCYSERVTGELDISHMNRKELDDTER